VAGFVTLALEVLGFRLLAPFFGYSVYVSGTLISTVLVALSAGYYLGGRLADRRPHLPLFFALVFAVSAYLTVIALAYQWVLVALSNMSIIAGSAAASIVVFAPPMVLLSTATPFLVRVQVGAGSAAAVGRTVGAISAVSTVGSIAGSLLTTFLLIPALGTRMTLIVCTAASYLLAAGYFLARRKAAVLLSAVLPILLIVAANLPVVVESGVVYLKESVYNLVKVIRTGGMLQLRLNDLRNVQSRFPDGQAQDRLMVGNYIDLMNVGPLVAQGKRVLILGLGGGSSANQLHGYYDATVHAVDLDPEVARVAERYFGIKRRNPGIRVYVEDARRFVRRRGLRYDVVEIDLYHGGLYVPFYVTTREFFEDIRSVLAPGGVVMMNVICDGRHPRGDDLYHAVGATLADVYPSVFSLRSPRHAFNAVFVAVNGAVDLPAVKERLASRAFVAHPDSSFDETVAHAAECIQAYTAPSGVAALTDDRAPVERMTWRMLHGIAAAAPAKPSGAAPN